MIIKQIAIGNEIEGFVESSFSDGFNIISSDDNNKGKTIVIQGILYALGNEPPAFPSSFDYKQYIYILQFEESGQEYWICRKNNEFAIYNNESLYLAESISEFKRYWDKNIFSLPRIMVNNIERIVDPSLLLQLFFVGQDKKSTDNIENRGLYKKVDFYNMIYEIAGLGSIKLIHGELILEKQRLQNLKEERSSLIKQHKLLKSKKHSAEILSSIRDKAAFENKVKQMEEIQEDISNLKKERNKCANRKLSWEKTIKELNSLNRSIKTGELRCMDCNSTNILYKGTKKDSFSFDVSTAEMRKTIIDSINEKIESYEEEKERYSLEIQRKQELLQNILSEDEISLETLVAYKEEVMDASEAEKKIIEIDEKIAELQGKIQITEKGTADQKEQQDLLLNSIVQKMNEFYRAIDSSGNIVIDDIFSKSGKIYSGSDATMFYLARLYAFADILEHNFPIIIDSFRAEDLSSSKEEVVLDWYSKLKNQLIFTTTLKKQEQGKYDSDKRITLIDYTNHMPSKILQKEWVKDISELAEKFSIEL